MEIQIIIPWGSNGNLGAAYNRLMKGVKNWVCFLDHDILQLNPSWYHMCLEAIDKVGDRAGWITGVTNAIACPAQLYPDAPKNNDIVEHMKTAKKLYDKHGTNLRLIDHHKTNIVFSGFMILTHKQAWIDSGGFTNGFLGVDNEYFKAITQKGYNTYVMPGLYMYHTYHTKILWGKL